MSTEHQQYSTANQSVAILQYAQLHHMEIVRTYADHGKSGLGLKMRSGLKQLLKDAVEPEADFQAVLVYDVSRWGRFQNPDQGAAYEYALEAAGVPVHYCAEQFENDGSLASSILKSIKRGMAGEYSRELSVKVWAGCARVCSLGFHMGGRTGYGLRRQLVDRNRKAKEVLVAGDYKSLQSDHILLIPGPAEEVAIVHRIYDMFIDNHLGEKEIARQLNGENIPWCGSKPWTRMIVQEILSNPKYIGAGVYNRKSTKLHRKLVYNDPKEWIWAPNAFEPIVSEERFEQARQLYVERRREISNEELLEDLRDLIDREGRITQRMIDEDVDSRSSSLYVVRFGSLRNAYGLVGWKPVRQRQQSKVNRFVLESRNSIATKLIQDLAKFGIGATYDINKRSFETDCGITMSLLVVRCTHYRGTGNYWYFYCRPSSTENHLQIVSRLTQANDAVLDYYVFPRRVITQSRLTLPAIKSPVIDAHRFDSLVALPSLLRRTEISDSTPDHFKSPSSRSIRSGESISASRLPIIQWAMKQLIMESSFRKQLLDNGHIYIPNVFWSNPLFIGEQILALSICEEYVIRILKSDTVRRHVEMEHADLLMQLHSTTGVAKIA